MRARRFRNETIEDLAGGKRAVRKGRKKYLIDETTITIATRDQRQASNAFQVTIKKPYNTG